ncbi:MULTISPECIES: phage holin family protein [Arcobacteraceae]|uniref:phage holin family protein n=1 Tax=Arcobacteraceae TaxID=2808963 RepID=UPI0013E8F659|nr:phage holin family protein [Arcobacter sp. CECT 8989]
MPVKESAAISLLTPKAMLMNFLYLPFLMLLEEHGEQLSILIVFMLLDFVTGMMKSRKLCKRITRYKFEIGAYMKFITLLLPFLFAFTAKGVGYKVDDFISFVIGTFIVIEFYSIIGNAYTIRTGKELEDKDFLSFALLMIRNKTEENLNRKFKDKDK